MDILTKFAIGVCLISTVTVRMSWAVQDLHGEMFLSSRFNENMASQAMDNNVTTCAESGRERGAWWALKLEEPITISRVTIQGSGPAFQIRVGNSFEENGQRGGFESNNLCHYSRLLTASSSPQSYECEHSMSGDVITIQTVDPGSVERLKLCEVQFT